MAPDAGASASRALDARIVRTRNDVLGAALRILVTDGLDAVTHANLATEAGYSKATVYNHWPTRTDILRDAFRLLDETPHSTPTGDLRADLVRELTAFRDAMRHHGLERALVVMAAQAMTSPDMAALRDQLVSNGDRIIRSLLSARFSGIELTAATRMLSGALFYAALMYGEIAQDDDITTTVDLLLHSGTPVAGA